MHRIFIDSISAFKGKAEMLLAGYSVIELERVGAERDPVIVSQRVASNLIVLEFLPVTTWH